MPKLILEEAEEALEPPKEMDEFKIEDVVFPEEVLEIIPVKKRKTKKQREKKMVANQPGKKGTRKKVTRKKMSPDFEIKGDNVEVY